VEVWRGDRAGFIDRNGEIAIPFSFAITPSPFIGFFEGMPAPAKKIGGLSGLINRSGEWVTEPVYDDVHPYYDGGVTPSSELEFKGFSVQRGNKTGYLDASGKVLIDLILDPLSTIGLHTQFCEDGQIIGRIDNKPRLFAHNGTPMQPTQGEISDPVACDGPYVVKVGRKYGYVDRDLRPITEARFESAGTFRHGFAPAKLDGKYGLLRPDGTWALEPAFDVIQPLAGGLALAKVGPLSAVIESATGRLIMNRQFDDVCRLQDAIAGVVVAGQMGVIDKNGWIAQPNYDGFYFLHTREFVRVRSHGKWGFLDAAGNTIAAQFDDATTFNRGIAFVKTNGAWCPIDRRGKFLPGMACQSETPKMDGVTRSDRPYVCSLQPHH